MPRKRTAPHAQPDTHVLVETIREKLAERITPSNALDLARTSFGSRVELIRALAAAVPARPGSKATNDPKLHYESTRRNVNRYFAAAGKEQRKPSATSLNALVALLKSHPDAQKAALHRLASEASVEIAIEGEVKISEDERRRRLPRNGWVSMTGATALDFLEAGINGESQRAYEVFFEAYHCSVGTIAQPTIDLSIVSK